MTKIFRLFFFLLVLGFSSCDNHKSKAVADGLIKGLSPYEKGALDLFFRTLLLETSVGYTLYGEKPVSDEGFRNEDVTINMSDHPMIGMGCIWKLGARVWEESGLSKIKSNYEIRVSHIPYWGWRQMQFINVRSFTNMLDRNLPLFQYALGPKVTSASLLEQFRDPKQNMASIFHENWTLNGVILGYGIQNALHGSRAEYLHTHLTSKSQKLEKDYGFSAIHHNAPSFGFSSINQEFDQLNKESLSTANRESPTPRLPWFSYFQHPESDRLLTDYKKVQSKLKDVLSSQDFLGEIFSRIFSASISVPKTPPFISLIEKELQKENDLSFLLGQALWKSLLDENNGKFPTSMEIGAFIHGMLDVESAMPFMKFDRAHWQEYLETGDLLQARKNLECAEMLLRQLQDTQIVLPGEIHYRVDWPGFGNEFFELDVREIKANFTMTSFSGDLLEAESEKMLQVFDLIPGLPLGMQGMKIGEVRDIYLHPRWARGGETQEPNLGLIVKIKLLWMGNRETLHQKLPLPIPLKSAEYSLEELEHKNRLLAEDLMTYFGQKTWARFILLKPLLSCEKVIRGIQEAQAGRLQPIKEKAIEQLNVMAWLRMESAMHHDFSSL